jgi:DNA-binding response OmpR family regulator
MTKANRTPPSAANRTARVLIADDHPQGVELLDAYLADTGFQVETAYDGEEALRKVQDWRPDLVLLDIMMPKISGFEVCKRLKADPATRGVAVLMITALDQPSDVERAVDAGTDDFLTKPINQIDLLHRIRALLASRQNPSELERALAYMDAVERGESY